MKGNKTPKIKVSLNRDEFDTLVWALRAMGEAEMPYLSDTFRGKIKATGKRLFERLQDRKVDFPISDDDLRMLKESVIYAIDPDRSVNCYFCNALVDEREAMNADGYNDDDGGSICKICVRTREEKK